MRRQKSQLFFAFCLVLALLIFSFLLARGASFSAQNGARTGFLLATIVVAIAFSWPGALLTALGSSALAFFAMQDALGGDASTRALFSSALTLDVALYFGVGMLSALLFHDRRGFEDMAFRDKVSGLLLWPRLLEKLGAEVGRARSNATPLALLLLECDLSAASSRAEKSVQPSGEMACLIAECARTEDIAGLGPPRREARIGRAKPALPAALRFAVILPRTAETGARALAERVLDAARGHARLTGELQALSCGIALMSLQNANKPPDVSTLVANAEEALAESQRIGHGHVIFFDDGMRAH